MCGLAKLCIRWSNTKHLCTTGFQETFHSSQTSFINSKDYLNTYVQLYGETLLDTIGTYIHTYVFMYVRTYVCITGLYQNAEAFPFPIGSSRTVQCN